MTEVVSADRIEQLWQQMLIVMQPVLWYEIESETMVAAAATLGRSLDRWQDALTEKKRLLDSYIIDCLALEALQSMYRSLESCLEKKGLFVKQYFFDTANTVLDNANTEIEWTEDGMMRPLKSVAFHVLVSRQASDSCGALCGSCEHQQCPYRISSEEKSERDAGVLKYSYGYQKIFGKK
jgi:hypothetical protein